jgi:hypothetical protein
MALTATTTTAAVAPGDLTIPLISSTGFLPGNPVRLDSEYCYVVSVPGTTSVVVRSRGSEGTTAAAHAVLTNVVTGPASDFPVIPAGHASQGTQTTSEDDIQTIGANTAIIAVPTRNTTYIINKATALSATTLAPPTLAQNGLKLTFISTTAAAHVITGATLFNNGITGVPWTTVTFAALAGAGFTATAVNGLWDVNAIPIAAAVVLS